MRAILVVAAMAGGYLLAMVAAGGPEALLSLSLSAGAGLVALLCATAAYLGFEARAWRRQARDRSSALAAERDRAASADALASTLAPVLEVISLEGALRSTVDAAHAMAGGSYAHVAALTGNHHRTVIAGDFDACPSWWHPSIQRLLLWSCREGDIVRSEEAVHGVAGFMAVPVGRGSGEKWGAIVVGGKRFGAEEERALRLLAERAGPALQRSGDALGGLDEQSRLPNRASLELALRRHSSRREALIVLAVGIEGVRSLGPAGDFEGGGALIRRVGERLRGNGRRVFRCGISEVVVLAGGSGEERARKLAATIRRLAQEEAEEPGRPHAASVGFAFSEMADEDSYPALDVALRALQEARGSTEGVVGFPAATGAEDGSRGGARIPEVVQALVGALEARDPGIGEHIIGVFQLAGRIGRELSLPRGQMDALAVGALLHDIGKIGIPDRILHKPDPLTQEEYGWMKQHPVLGGELIAPLEELAPALPAIRHHHERFDGRGYPDGLSGADVPLIARVVSVADAFDSMIRDRPYAQGVSREVALKKVKDNSGTQFDPRVVRALLRAAADLHEPREDSAGEG